MRPKRWIGLAAVLLAIPLLAVAPAQPSRAANILYQVMLPLIDRPPAVISGYLTVWNQPLVGAHVDTPCGGYTADTDTNGYYFLYIKDDSAAGPCILEKYIYQGEHPDGSLGRWYSGLVYPYLDPGSPKLSNFNLADILPLLPVTDTVTTLPITFRWQKVPVFPEASYKLVIGGSVQGYFSPLLGDVDQYTITEMPSMLGTDTPYWWMVHAYGSDGSYGYGWYHATITFVDGNAAANKFLSPDLRPNALRMMSYFLRLTRP